MSSLRRAGSSAAILILAVAASAPAPAQTPAPADTRPPCARSLVALDDTLDSSRTKAGDVFRFRLVDPATAPDGTPLPADTLGYGVVAIASHADRGGRGGYLAIETRFFVLPDGRHVSAIIDRVNDEAASALGASANAPGVLGLIPIVGYAVGGYDAMHHGKDATIPRGTRLAVFLGDDNALGKCRAPAPGETAPPVPVTTAAPAAPAMSGAPSAQPSNTAPGNAPPAGATGTSPATPRPAIPTPPAPPATPAPAISPTASPTM